MPHPNKNKLHDTVFFNMPLNVVVEDDITATVLKFKMKKVIIFPRNIFY